jgi:signal transduction histidine kinase
MKLAIVEARYLAVIACARDITREVTEPRNRVGRIALNPLREAHAIPEPYWKSLGYDTPSSYTPEEVRGDRSGASSRSKIRLRHPQSRESRRTGADPMWIVDRQGEVIAANRAFARWRSTVHADGAISSWAEAQRRALDGRAVVMDVHLVVSGIERSFAVHGYPVKDRNCAVMMSREITGMERQAQDVSIERGVPGRAGAQGDVVWIADILDESTLHRGELAAAAGLDCVVAVPLRDGERFAGVLELFAHAVRPLSERRKRILLRTGQALARLLERRRAEDERRHLLTLIERRGVEWMMTFDSIELPIFLITLGGAIARLNRAARNLAGGGYDDLVGRSMRSFGDFDPWTTINDIVAAVRDSGVSCTAQISRDDRLWDVAASLLAASESEERRVIVVLREITEIVRLQESVRRGEQLAALGELVAGVAHEVRNPIFGMGLTVDLLRERIHGDAAAEEMASDLQKWLIRLNGLMEKLLEYGKTWTVDLQPGRLEDVVKQAVDACALRAGEASVSIDALGNGAEGVVLMDSARLIQVFENLIMNAVQHSEPGARVTISFASDATEIEYSVRDRGPGFREDDLPRIFQPFFTRRPFLQRRRVHRQRIALPALQLLSDVALDPRLLRFQPRLGGTAPRGGVEHRQGDAHAHSVKPVLPVAAHRGNAAEAGQQELRTARGFRFLGCELAALKEETGAAFTRALRPRFRRVIDVDGHFDRIC